MSRDKACAAIGQVVINAQFFETAFIICAKLVFKNQKASSIQDIEPLSMKTSFKQATKAALNELKTQIDLDGQFESLMDSVIDRRHTLLHRWQLEKGWSAIAQDESWQEVEQYANYLSNDLNAITRILVCEIHKWLEKFPEITQNLAPLDSNWLSHLPPEFQGIQIEK